MFGRRFLGLLAFCFLSCTGALFSEEIWTPERSMEMARLFDIDISPDGSEALLAVGRAHIQGDESFYRSRIYRVPTDGSVEPRPFSAPTCSSWAPSWSPDGRWIAFVSSRSGSGQLYIIPTDGGEAICLTDLSSQVRDIAWSPDSQRIAFLAQEELSSEELRRRRERDDAVVVDGEFRSTLIWITELEEESARPILDQRFGEGVVHDLDWSPDEERIVFAYSPRPEADSVLFERRLATVELESGEIEMWPALSACDGDPHFSPDGHWVAFSYSDDPLRTSLNRYLAVRNVESGEVTRLAVTPNEGPFLVGTSLIGWTPDSSAVLYLEPSNTRYTLLALPIDGGEPVVLDDGETFFHHVSLNRSGTLLGMVVEGMDRLPEVYVSPLAGFAPHAITSFHEWAEELPMPRTEKVYWRSVDGLEIEGLLTYPLDYVPGQRVPLLLEVHGGPQAAFQEHAVAASFLYPVAAFAEHGYAVLRANPRGSTGYGREFRLANYEDWGGSDYLDLMTGVDHVVAMGVADPDRLGVMGWSYGGYMTAWMVTQSDRFKAASMGAGISNLVSFAGTTDIPTFSSDYFGGEISEQIDLYRERSPLFYLDQVETPLLIQHGEHDARVPLGQGLEFYRALKRRGAEVQMVLYPRSGHSPSEPKLALDAMKRNLDWFLKYIPANETQELYDGLEVEEG